jgi:signal transduction histidine kinase
MGEWLLRVAAVQGFLPHGYCFQWSSSLLALMAGSDVAIFLSYYSIPIALIAFVRARKDLGFNWVFWLFAAFICLCGTTHFIDVVTVWIPAYWLQAWTKALTAFVSVATAIALWVLMPKLLRLPSNDQLAAVVTRLEREVAERSAAQQRLDQMNAELEDRVRSRNAELEESMRERERLKDADRARAVAEASNRAKSEFLSSMSHELRTPLNAVIGFAQLLQVEARNGSMSPGKQLDWSRRIEAAGGHLLSLIEDVLEMAKIEAKGVEIRKVRFDVVAAARECEAMISVLARDRGISVEMALPDADVYVESDARRFKQILMNLLSNAIKYNVPGGHVRASVVIGAQGCEIAVADTGVGMTPEQQEQLFAPFNRLGKEGDARYEGTGLGLAITRQVVRALGGVIEVQSALARGSEFRVRLPITAAR